jgi:uncharacterized protein (DUF2267 family)
MNTAVGDLLRLPGTEAPSGRLPPGSAAEESRPTTTPSERETVQERVSQPGPTAPTRPERLQGQPITFKEFITVVQEAGALESAGEAEVAARAALGELGGCLSWPQTQSLAEWLPSPLRQLVRLRSFESSMSRFAPRAFLDRMGENDGIGEKRAARDTRALLLALDRTLPAFLREHLHSELASLWVPLTVPPAASTPTGA